MKQWKPILGAVARDLIQIQNTQRKIRERALSVGEEELMVEC